MATRARANRTEALLRRRIEHGHQPLEIMLRRMDDPSSVSDAAFEAACAAAPYCHPKLQAINASVQSNVTVNGGIDAPPRSESWEEWNARRRAELAEMGASTGAADTRH